MPGISRSPPADRADPDDRAERVTQGGRADLRPVRQGAGVLQAPQAVGGGRAGQADPAGQLGDPQPRRGLQFRGDPPVDRVQRHGRFSPFDSFEGLTDEFPLS